MIYQLPSGRIIEISVEQYLSLTDDEIRELNGMSSAYTLECNNPFYNLFNAPSPKEEFELPEDLIDEILLDTDSESTLLDIDDIDKLEDDYFHSDDI